jgi:heat shock protein HtpX
VYLSRLPGLAVTEAGGFLGFGAQRVLILGAPVLEMLTVQELKAGLAHEIGHFLGGDTRLTGIISWTTGMFRSVLQSGERGAFREGTQHIYLELSLTAAQGVTRGLVGVYSRLFFLVMHRTSRRQELVADAWAAALAGPRAAIAALDAISVQSCAYDTYLQNDVAFAIRNGVFPTDLLQGFDRFRKRFLATEPGVRLAAHVRNAPTEVYDTHPSIRARIEWIRGLDVTPAALDDSPASTLVADLDGVRTWAAEESVALFGVTRPLRRLPWSAIGEQVYEPAVRERGRKIAERLFPLIPDAATLAAMALTLVHAVRAGRAGPLIEVFEPRVRHLTGTDGQRIFAGITSDIAGALLQASLLDRGAKIDVALGSPSVVLVLPDGTQVDAVEVVHHALGWATHPVAEKAMSLLGGAPT